MAWGAAVRGGHVVPPQAPTTSGWRAATAEVSPRRSAASRRAISPKPEPSDVLTLVRIPLCEVLAALLREAGFVVWMEVISL